MATLVPSRKTCSTARPHALIAEFEGTSVVEQAKTTQRKAGQVTLARFHLRLVIVFLSFVTATAMSPLMMCCLFLQ